MNPEELEKLITENKRKDSVLKELFDAVSRNNLKKVKSICEKNQSIIKSIINEGELINGKLRSLLECAADSEMAQYLVEQGASLTKAMINVIQRKDFKAIKSIYEKNQPIIKDTLKEQSDLLEAATRDFNYDGKIVEYLVERGADPNTVDSRKRFLLHLQIAEGYFKGARALVDVGANVNAKNQEENSWHMTGQDGNASIGDKSLHFAVRVYDNNKINKPEKAKEALEFIKFLIEKGADLNVKNRVEKIPLSLAVRYDCSEVSKLLIKHMLFQNFNTEMPQILNDNIELSNYWNECKVEAVKFHDRVGDRITLTSGGVSIGPVMRTLSEFLDHDSRKKLVAASLKSTEDNHSTPLNLSPRECAVIGVAMVAGALALYFLAPLILTATGISTTIGGKLALGVAGGIAGGGVGYLTNVVIDKFCDNEITAQAVPSS
jgi:ankyrin repeat protein